MMSPRASWLGVVGMSLAALLQAGCSETNGHAKSPGELSGESAAFDPTRGPAGAATSAGSSAFDSTATADGSSSSASTAAAASGTTVAKSEGTPASTSKSASRKSGIQDITFDNLKFDIEKDEPFEWEMLNDEVRALRGAQIRIRGWILPQSVFQQMGITEFVFVRDNLECCFGPGAALYDCMRVEMKPGHTATFSVLPITIEGELEFDPLTLGKRTFALYMLKDTIVK